MSTTITTSRLMCIHLSDRIQIGAKEFLIVKRIDEFTLHIRPCRWFDQIIPGLLAWMSKWDERFILRYEDRW